MGGNTTHQPPAPKPVQATVVGDSTAAGLAETAVAADVQEAAEALLRSLGHVDRRLALPARTVRNWLPLAARWFAAGLRPDQVRSTLTRGLNDARSPLGVVRWRLEHALPDAPPPTPSPSPKRPRPEPRLARMRECAGEHVQPRLFLPEPGSTDGYCRDCRGSRDHTAATPPPSPSQGTTGFDDFLAARRAVRVAARPASVAGRTPRAA